MGPGPFAVIELHAKSKRQSSRAQDQDLVVHEIDRPRYWRVSKCYAYCRPKRMSLTMQYIANSCRQCFITAPPISSMSAHSSQWVGPVQMCNSWVRSRPAVECMPRTKIAAFMSISCGHCLVDLCDCLVSVTVSAQQPEVITGPGRSIYDSLK